MTFKTDMASDLAVFFNSDEFAETVSYFDGTTSADILAVVEYPGNTAEADQATILVKKTDVPDPAYRQTFTIGGAVWYIHAEKGKHFVVSEDDNTFVLAIRRGERFSSWT